MNADEEKEFKILQEKSRRLEAQVLALQEKAYGQDIKRESALISTDVFFKEAGINFKKIINKKVEIDTGRRTFSGILLAINESFKLFQLKLGDGRVCVVKLNKINSIVYEDADKSGKLSSVFKE